ncbi:histone deacetylase [Massilia sp. W12]|uniref:histone deacetylase family protein n=1 Tax=Massilia sp. W12 TaxID=3126507 RepID=UPI0030D0DA1B
MHILYDEGLNIDFGLLNYLHPFDGCKFRKVRRMLADLPSASFQTPPPALELARLQAHMGARHAAQCTQKEYILRALELPALPLPFSWIDRKILLPMRRACAATLYAAQGALQGQSYWNLAGGYHHASALNSEGFCVYNDIYTALQELRGAGSLGQQQRVLLIDVDAHHGNGNAEAFETDRSVFILDQFNSQIYPYGERSRQRLDLAVPLRSGVDGGDYLRALDQALAQLPAQHASRPFALAFVIAGSDVLESDPLGGMALTIQDCIAREERIWRCLHCMQVPAVWLGGGGYGKQSAQTIAGALRALYRLEQEVAGARSLERL